ncbi:hypothetical protein CW362_16835 [Streptomyces populi]|uniref:Uncharacterized protein n=1 Tax=Streptomyces populi TaxID=2058924 RepID=A0A2I0SPQ1_9ACTN|nr:hypothetical protein CW362_16835 [Streptomyces populi]
MRRVGAAARWTAGGVGCGSGTCISWSVASGYCAVAGSVAVTEFDAAVPAPVVPVTEVLVPDPAVPDPVAPVTDVVVPDPAVPDPAALPDPVAPVTDVVVPVPAVPDPVVPVTGAVAPDVAVALLPGAAGSGAFRYWLGGVVFALPGTVSAGACDWVPTRPETIATTHPVQMTPTSQPKPRSRRPRRPVSSTKTGAGSTSVEVLVIDSPAFLRRVASAGSVLPKAVSSAEKVINSGRKGHDPTHP